MYKISLYCSIFLYVFVIKTVHDRQAHGPLYKSKATLFTGICKDLRIVSYTIYNGISKFQRKISRKIVIIGKVLFDSFYYTEYCG